MDPVKEHSGVVSNFIQIQMDYILFSYGLGFILLAGAAAALSRMEKQLLPWKWLCLFGISHGINEWLDLLAFSLKDSPAFSVARLIVMILSFLFLIEFGRAGSSAIGRKNPGRWIYVPLLLLSGLGAFAGYVRPERRGPVRAWTYRRVVVCRGPMAASANGASRHTSIPYFRRDPP